MRTYINRNTKINGFGIGQDRVVVRDARGVHTALHLAMWQASRLWHGLLTALLALRQSVTAAATAPAFCSVPAVEVLRSGKSMRLSLPTSRNG